MKNNSFGMTIIVKTVTRLTLGLILIYGIFILLESHIGPGGGFAGGVIIALSFIQLILAFGKDFALKKLNKRRSFLLMCLGGFIFLIVSLLGFTNMHKLSNLASGGGFFGITIASLGEIAVSCMVGMGLFFVFLVLVLSDGGLKEE